MSGRGPSKLNARATLVVMSLFLALFVYEFIVRESALGSGLPGLPTSLTMFAAFMAPFALIMFGIQAVMAVGGAIGRKRQGQPRSSRRKRTLGAWGVVVLLGAATYLVYEVSMPITVDDAMPGWLGVLVLPVGIATLVITLRAIALTVGSGGAGKPTAEPLEWSASLNGADRS